MILTYSSFNARCHLYLLGHLRQCIRIIKRYAYSFFSPNSQRENISYNISNYAIFSEIILSRVKIIKIPGIFCNPCSINQEKLWCDTPYISV